MEIVPSLTRRALLLSGAALALAADAPAEGAPALHEWDMGQGRCVAALVPAGTGSGRLPLVIALHGAGETLEPPREGALAWPRDYALSRAMERLARPPLRLEDYEGLTTEPLLQQVNQDLSREPFQGVVVVCPRIPPVSKDRSLYEPYVRWLVTELLPEARRRLPVLPGPESTGIDGVSLGGLMALRVGLAHPELFSAVGALQPALSGASGPDLERRLRQARAQGGPQLRLTTSDADVYRDVVQEAHAHLDGAGLAHDYSELVGPHGYAFNRGPGAFELLLWHDRRLARR
jgi:predicted esterase